MGLDSGASSRGQVAIEYMIVVSFALMVIIPYALYLQDVSTSFARDNDLSMASNDVQRIGQTADWVYSQGPPSKMQLTLSIPSGVEDITFVNKTMTWRMRVGSGYSDIYYNSVAPLNGSLPTVEGYYNILVSSTGTGVDITVS
jgi:hypothetical protein